MYLTKYVTTQRIRNLQLLERYRMGLRTYGSDFNETEQLAIPGCEYKV